MVRINQPDWAASFCWRLERRADWSSDRRELKTQAASFHSTAHCHGATHRRAANTVAKRRSQTSRNHARTKPPNYSGIATTAYCVCMRVPATTPASATAECTVHHRVRLECQLGARMQLQKQPTRIRQYIHVRDKPSGWIAQTTRTTLQQLVQGCALFTEQAAAR